MQSTFTHPYTRLTPSHLCIHTCVLGCNCKPDRMFVCIDLRVLSRDPRCLFFRSTGSSHYLSIVTCSLRFYPFRLTHVSFPFVVFALPYFPSFVPSRVSSSLAESHFSCICCVLFSRRFISPSILFSIFCHCSLISSLSVFFSFHIHELLAFFPSDTCSTRSFLIHCSISGCFSLFSLAVCVVLSLLRFHALCSHLSYSLLTLTDSALDILFL